MLKEDLTALLSWYGKHKRGLPWRETSDPYPVIVSEFMLQQTTVAAVVPKFRAWLRRFPDLEALASANLEEVFHYWSGLGYYQRARRLHRAAKAMWDLGGVPNSYEDLLKLPGFGPYTAAAVASICFEQPHLSIDTNVIRVLYRYFSIAESANNAASHRRLRDEMSAALEAYSPGEVNQAIMELGATLCSVREPSCLLCPLRKGCSARRSPGGPGFYPLPSPRKTAKLTKGRALAIEMEGSRAILLVKGTSLGLLSDLHQPPIYFFEQDMANSMSETLGEIWQELSAVSSLSRWKVSYGISGRKLYLECYSWRLQSSVLEKFRCLFESVGVRTVLWSPFEEKESQAPSDPIPVSTLTRKILQKWVESPSVSHPRDSK